MEYPAKRMSKNQLMKIGISREELDTAYQDPRQRFAMKLHPEKKTSPIYYDTDELEKWRRRRIENQKKMLGIGL